VADHEGDAAWAKMALMPTPISRSRRPSAASGAGRESATWVVNGVMTAMMAAGTVLALAMAVCLVGWFFANGGAHGNTLDALRVGSAAWVLGLGASAATGIGHVALTPLGLTLIHVMAVSRSVRWAWRRFDLAGSSLRSLGTAWGMFVLTYIVVAVIIAGLVTPASIRISMSGTVGAALVISALPSAWVGLSENGDLAGLRHRIPGTVRVAARVAVQCALMLVVAAALVVALGLVVSWGDAQATYDALHLGFGDALMLTVVCVLALPNAIGLAIAYLAGPGFAVGTATSVTVSSVSLGALPLFPMVAALPDPGSQSGWLILLLFVPALCAIAAGMRVQRHQADDGAGWEQITLRGLGGGAFAGLVLAIFASVSGGALGDHRMAHIGAGFWAVMLCLVGGMALGGALGSLGTAGWQQWRGARAADAD